MCFPCSHFLLLSGSCAFWFWEGIVKVGSMCYPFCSKHKAQEAAVCIYNTQVPLRQSIPETGVMKYCLMYVWSNGTCSRKTSQRFLVSMVRNILVFLMFVFLALT